MDWGLNSAISLILSMNTFADREAETSGVLSLFKLFGAGPL